MRSEELLFCFRHQSGWTLLECLLSLVLSLFLCSIALFLLPILPAFISDATEKTLHREMTSRLLVHAVHMAGFSGCLPPASRPEPIPASPPDQLILWRAGDQPAYLLKQEGERVLASQDFLFSKGDEILVTNCLFSETGQILQVIRSRKNQTLVMTHPFHHFFSAGAEIYPAGYERFFIDPHPHSGLAGLYMENFRREKILLLQDIHSLKMTYYKKNNRIVATRLDLQEMKGEKRHEWSLYAALRNA